MESRESSQPICHHLPEPTCLSPSLLSIHPSTHPFGGYFWNTSLCLLLFKCDPAVIFALLKPHPHPGTFLENSATPGSMAFSFRVQGSLQNALLCPSAHLSLGFSSNFAWMGAARLAFSSSTPSSQAQQPHPASLLPGTHKNSSSKL